jgi:hypothetical protein
MYGTFDMVREAPAQDPACRPTRYLLMTLDFGKTSHDKPGKPVPNQVPTTSARVRCRPTQHDGATHLTCRNTTLRDVSRLNRKALHAEGQGFESP